MFCFVAVSEQGPHEKRLLHTLLDHYNVLERPVANESDPLQLSFGLTLMQIIDVVSTHYDFTFPSQTLSTSSESIVTVEMVHLATSIRCHSVRTSGNSTTFFTRDHLQCWSFSLALLKTFLTKLAVFLRVFLSRC